MKNLFIFLFAIITTAQYNPGNLFVTSSYDYRPFRFNTNSI